MSDSTKPGLARTRLGIERLLDEQIESIRGQRVAIVGNKASVLPDFRHIVDAFAEHNDIQLTTLFGPQHGIRGDVQDNMVETEHATDPKTGLPVYSLYSETREPTEEMLREIDTIVFDMQDVGCRIYTFAYTMANCMRAAKKFGKRVVVCDRPNPINGVSVEGNVTEKDFTSFVGQFEVPTRHGMTLGELARLYNEHFGIGATLELARMERWHRPMYADRTGLPWVMPSPNMPTLDTAVVYPGTVLLEGTMLSEGRGTTRPFELVGAPWIDAERFAGALNALELPGVYFRPAVFEPTFQKHARRTCGGCQIHLLDREAFRPVATGVAVIQTFYRLDPSSFAWRPPPYEYEHDKPPIDILAGSDLLRRQIETDVPLEEIVEGWREDEEAFHRLRAPYLLS